MLASALFSLSLLAQPAGDYSISGVVINAQTGEPVKYALVTLMGFPKMDPSQQFDPAKPPRPIQKSIQAGGGGEFQFTGLDKSRYIIRAEKPGFTVIIPQGQPNMTHVDLTASISGLQLPLSPLGVIEGKVVDQNGEPLRGVNIVALQPRIEDGRRETDSVRSVASDDRGLYRLWNLRPGRYYIKAAGKSGGTYRYVGDNTPNYSSWQSFTPVYFGGASTLDSATAIQIEPGSKASADLQLAIEPAFRIRGTLINAPGSTVTFNLLRGTEDVSASRTSLNATTGTFEVQDVTPGAYVLRVTQAGKMRGEAKVTVNQADVDGVSISLSPAVAVRGTTKVLGEPGSDSNHGDEERRVIKPWCNVSLHEHGGSIRTISERVRQLQTLRDQETGGFTVNDVLPGVYAVSIQCIGGYATSAMSGGVDLLANPNLVVQPGVAPAPIEIMVKPGGGELSGEFTVEAVPKNAGVLLVPALSESTGPVMLPVAYNPGSQGKSEFTLRWLAPGDYTVYAFSEWQQVEFRDPAFLQTITGGVSVRIEDGKQEHVTVTRIVK